MRKLFGRGKSERRWPALAIACLALFLALGGGVYAAAKIDGHRIRAASLPGNRLVPGSVPANRLREASIPASRLAPGSITGAQVNAATLGQVPSAAHAESADRAGEAVRAQRAESAAVADRVSGYRAGCMGETREFGGACWELRQSEQPRTALEAAAVCANRGGELPGALSLATFSKQPGIALDAGGEWSGDVADFSGPTAYGVITVTDDAELRPVFSTDTRKFRCVRPLLG